VAVECRIAWYDAIVRRVDEADARRPADQVGYRDHRPIRAWLLRERAEMSAVLDWVTMEEAALLYDPPGGRSKHLDLVFL
jgi:hypothetical protein